MIKSRSELTKVVTRIHNVSKIILHNSLNRHMWLLNQQDLVGKYFEILLTYQQTSTFPIANNFFCILLMSILCAALTSDNVGRISKYLTVSFLPTLLMQRRPLGLLIRRTRKNSCLSSRSSFQFPTSSWNYSNKPIQLLTGTMGYLTLLILDSLPPTVPSWSLLSAASI